MVLTAVAGFVLLCGLTVLFPAPSQAVDILTPVCGTGSASSTDVCKEHTSANNKQNPVIKALRVAISILSIVVGVSSVIVIIFSGFHLVTANGDASKVASARSAIIYALVGIVIAILAGTIVAFVLSKL